ncbi:sulfotransferase, partial [Thermodesulfobacteriota bacterium]
IIHLAKILFQGKLQEAIASFRQAISLSLDSAELYNNLGNALRDFGEMDEAVTCFDKAIALKPDFVEAHNCLGIVFRETGKMDDAIACFRKALALKPDYAVAFRNLSLMVQYTEVDDDVLAMENLYKKRDLPDVYRIDLGFALGKVYGNVKDYDKSFHFILGANQLKRKTYEYSIQEDRDLFARIKETFSPDFFASHHGPGFLDRTPIFILGMPRSGTTLVEQILASHPLVFGAGELAILRNMINDMCTGKEVAEFPECMKDLGLDVIKRMGKNYIKKIRKYSNEAEYITDKLPYNFLYVGLIKTILPAAKIIHCKRNPMDTCFSIYKNDFSGTHKYAFDLVELGQYYNLYSDLMAHWEKVLPGFMYTLRYEELIADQQNQTKSLLDFCNLHWDEACLTFHKTERTVSTASLAQVRQPIYKDSVELWKRYEKQLNPLKKVLY